MRIPRTTANRLLATAQAAGGQAAAGVVTREGGLWRVEAEAVAGREVLAAWVVNGATPVAATACVLVLDTDTRGVLQLSATENGATVLLELMD